MDVFNEEEPQCIECDPDNPILTDEVIAEMQAAIAALRADMEALQTQTERDHAEWRRARTTPARILEKAKQTCENPPDEIKRS